MDGEGGRPEPVGRRFGRYLLLEAIDRGGMAEVYRAVTHGPGGFQRQFVIKRIRKEKAASKDFVEMFINEARISALLEHPNIVQVYDFGQVEGDYFLAMEYLRGRNLLTLGRRLRSLTREMPTDLTAYVAREVARGLHYAHTLSNSGKPLGIVHRDISPSNIMLLKTGGVKLLDFGIARATMKLRAETPVGGLIKGKLSYLSPEQVRGKGVDGRSDVFSLGVVLWECLTGLRLFYNPNDLETMRNVLHRPVPRPSELRLGLPQALDHITMRALERDLTKRYPDAATMAADLEEYLRECRFSPETLVRLVEELFGDEDSARELPLPEDTSFSPPPQHSGLKPSPSADSLRPPPVGAPGPSEDNDYATVSSVHRLALIASRHRRRRILQGAAAAVVVGGALTFGVLRIPGGRPDAGVPIAAAPPPPIVAAPVAAPASPPPAPPSPVHAIGEVANAPTAPTVEEHERAHAGRSRVESHPSAPPPSRAEASEPEEHEHPLKTASAAEIVRGRRGLTRGLQALRSGEYMKAVQELEPLVNSGTTAGGSDAYRGLAEAEFELARYGKALAHARRAASLAPRDPQAKALVGDAYFKLRRYQEANDAYAAAVALAPGDSNLRARQQRAKEKSESGDSGGPTEP